MAARTTQQPNRTVAISRWRINALLIVFVLVLGRISVQLGDIQLVRHTELRDRARNEIDQRLLLPPDRGVIRDRKGNVLALNVRFQSLFVQPHLIDAKQAPKIAAVLSGLLSMPVADIQESLTNTDYQWRAVKRWLQPEIADRISLLKEEEPALWQGLQFIYEPRRVYPQNTFAASVIGPVNLEGVGISGVEASYDDLLKGATGVITAEVDATSRPIWIAPQEQTPATDGSDLDLTIDPLIQHTIETILKQAVEAHSAD